MSLSIDDIGIGTHILTVCRCHNLIILSCGQRNSVVSNTLYSWGLHLSVIIIPCRSKCHNCFGHIKIGITLSACQNKTDPVLTCTLSCSGCLDDDPISAGSCRNACQCVPVLIRIGDRVIRSLSQNNAAFCSQYELHICAPLIYIRGDRR